MNQSPSESQIREQLQRLKRADADHAPAFEDVLLRHPSAPGQRTSRQVPLVVALCTAALLLVAFGFWSSRDDVTTDSVSMTPVPDDRPADVDFDYYRQLVDEHFESVGGPALDGLPVWSSRTESLLAVNLGARLVQEQP